jgi:ABC-type transport system involved in multi-copper enzyme maturation permease subunit
MNFADVLRSEWTKLRSVRSTYWTGLIAVLATIGVCVIVCVKWADDIRHSPGTTIDATTVSLNGIFLAQVAVGTLGVIVISSEYGTGMIRATFGAVPQRRAVLAAKGLVFGVVTLVIAEILSFTAFGIGQAILSAAHAGVSLGQPEVLRAVIGGGLYLAAVGLLGFGIGALVRHTAGALSAFFGVLFAVTALADLLPSSWRNDVMPYMPANAGTQIFAVQRVHDSLAPWTGLGVLCLYAAAAIGAATVLVTRRDA